jgi:hypothetical protein
LLLGREVLSRVGTRFLAVLYAAEGFFYVAYVLWRVVPGGLSLLYRVPHFIESSAPPFIENWFFTFLFAMFCVGVFFISRALILLFGEGKLRFSDYFVSGFSVFLWAIPALVSFGNAYGYFTHSTLSLRPYAYANLTNGMFFATIGAINVLSLIYMRLSRSARAQHEKEGGLFPLSK